MLLDRIWRAHGPPGRRGNADCPLPARRAAGRVPGAGTGDGQRNWQSAGVVEVARSALRGWRGRRRRGGGGVAVGAAGGEPGELAFFVGGQRVERRAAGRRGDKAVPGPDAGGCQGDRSDAPVAAVGSGLNEAAFFEAGGGGGRVGG